MATRKQDTERLAKLMEKIDIAMLTTVGQGGLLVSRPLSTQAATFDGERVWFFSEGDSPKIAEIQREPKVNVAYASKDANTYISAAGEAFVNHDQARIDEFWNDALKAFFPKGPKDPNLVLIEVRIDTIEYWDGPGSWIGKAITFAIARVTGNDDVMGENRIIDVESGLSRKPAGTDRPGRPREQAPMKKAAGRSSSTAPAKSKTAATTAAPAGKRAATASKKTAAKKTAAKSSKTSTPTSARKAGSKSSR